MDNQRSHRSAGASVFISSIHGLANVLAFVASFIGTPVVFGWTAPWISQYASSNYGADVAGLCAFVWGICVGATIFLVARATLAAALITGAIAMAARFAM